MTTFSTPEDIYLASVDNLHYVGSYVKRVSPLFDHFWCVIGGLGGLNFFTKLYASDITFYDVNPAAIDYAKMLFELIKLSQNRVEFISRVFSRPLAGNTDLEGQGLFLSQPGDFTIFNETRNALPLGRRSCFDFYFSRILKGNYTNGNFLISKPLTNCSIMLPCFPVGPNIPVFQSTSVRVNTFYYGKGWLESETTFNQIKQVLLSPTIQFQCFDLTNYDFSAIFEDNQSVLLYSSNIDDWVGKDAWSRTISAWRRSIKAHITSVSLYHGIKNVT